MVYFGQKANPGGNMLSDNEYQRYNRHIIIPDIGIEGQKRLKRSKVLIVGAGGLGTPLGYYLTAVGVGRIGLADADVVEMTNLQRQVLFDSGDVGGQKCPIAVTKLQKLNPEVEVLPYPVRLTSQNAVEIMAEFDIIADATDNFGSRYLINDTCVLLDKPNVHGSVFQLYGQTTVFPAGGPCYRCLYPNPIPPEQRPGGGGDNGVLGVLPAIIGSIQAAEIIKLITGCGRTLAGRLLLLDALNMEFRELNFEPDSHCPVCGSNPKIVELTDHPDYQNS